MYFREVSDVEGSLDCPPKGMIVLSGLDETDLVNLEFSV